MKKEEPPVKAETAASESVKESKDVAESAGQESEKPPPPTENKENKD